jgi:hypothetical protein
LNLNRKTGSIVAAYEGIALVNNVDKDTSDAASPGANV